MKRRSPGHDVLERVSSVNLLSGAVGLRLLQPEPGRRFVAIEIDVTVVDPLRHATSPCGSRCGCFPATVNVGTAGYRRRLRSDVVRGRRDAARRPFVSKRFRPLSEAHHTHGRDRSRPRWRRSSTAGGRHRERPGDRRTLSAEQARISTGRDEIVRNPMQKDHATFPVEGRWRILPAMRSGRSSRRRSRVAEAHVGFGSGTSLSRRHGGAMAPWTPFPGDTVCMEGLATT